MSDSDTSCVLHTSAAGVTELRGAPALFPALTQHIERFFCSFCTSVPLHRISSTFPPLPEQIWTEGYPPHFSFPHKGEMFVSSFTFCLKQVKKLHLENRKLRGLKSALRVWEFASFHSHLRCWHVAGTALSSHLMLCLSLYPKPEVYGHGVLSATLPKCSVQGLLRACAETCFPEQ